jgi:hypothetical protein
MTNKPDGGMSKRLAERVRATCGIEAERLLIPYIEAEFSTAYHEAAAEMQEALSAVCEWEAEYRHINNLGKVSPSPFVRAREVLALAPDIAAKAKEQDAKIRREAFDDCARHRCPMCRGGNKPKWMDAKAPEAEGFFHVFDTGNELCHAQHERWKWANP